MNTNDLLKQLMDKNPDIHSLLQNPEKLLQNPEVQQLIQDPTFQQLLHKPSNNINQSTDKNLKEKLKEKLKLKQISRMTKTNKEKYLESKNL